MVRFTRIFRMIPYFFVLVKLQWILQWIYIYISTRIYIYISTYIYVHMYMDIMNVAEDSHQQWDLGDENGYIVEQSWDKNGITWDMQPMSKWLEISTFPWSNSIDSLNSSFFTWVMFFKLRKATFLLVKSLSGWWFGTSSSQLTNIFQRGWNH